MNAEKYLKLKYPIHKIVAKTPAELFAQLPGLKRYFKTVTIDSNTGLPTSKTKTHEGTSGCFFFNLPEDVVKFMKYVFFVYDPNSDLVDEFPVELRLRKEAAAMDAGWKKDANDQWAEYIEEIFALKHQLTQDLIVDFLKVLKEPVWREMCFQQEELESISRKRLEDLAFSIKNDYKKESQERIDNINLLWKRFYSEHHDLKEVTQKRQFPITPENVFKELDLPDEWWKVRQTTDVD